MPDYDLGSRGRALRAARRRAPCARLGHVKAGATIGVYGLGPIGLPLVRLCRLAGATRIVATDLLRHRRDAASGPGVELVEPDDVGYSRAIEFVSAGLLDLDGLITHRFPRDRVDDASCVLAARGIKVVVEPRTQAP